MAANRGWSVGVVSLGLGALASGLALSGCAKRTVASNDPAKVCASQETTDRIRDLVFSKAANAAGSSNRYAIPKLRPQTKVSVSRPLVESYDPATRRTSCTGVLAVGLPTGVMTVGALRVPIRYSAQPLADGTGVSFDLSGADEVVAAIAGSDLTVWAETNAKPEPGLVVEVAPSTGAVTSTRVAAAAPAPAPPVVARPTPAATAPSPAPVPAPRPAVVASTPTPKPKPPSKPAAPAVVATAPRAPEPTARPRPAPAPVARAVRPPPEPPPTAPRRPEPSQRTELARRAPPQPLPPVRPAPSPATELARRAPSRLPPLKAAPPLPEPRLASAAPSAAPAAAPLSDGPVRVFVHVTGPEGRREANVVRSRLNDLLLRGAPVATPAIRTVARAPARNEVRCLKAADCAVARRVGAYLARTLPGGVTVVDMSRTYENDPGVRSGSLELWLKPGVAPPDEGDDDQ